MLFGKRPIRLIKKPYSEFFGQTLGDIEKELVEFIRYFGSKDEKPDDLDFTKKMKRYIREGKTLVIENKTEAVFHIWRGEIKITPAQFTFLDVPEEDDWEGGVFEISKKVLKVIYKIKRGYY